MSIVSHLHQLFNAETCQSSLHTLRWKDRPLQCPRCQSHNVGPWGAYHYQPGLKRYRCNEKGCTRIFNDLMGTLLDCCKRSVMHCTGDGRSAPRLRQCQLCRIALPELWGCIVMVAVISPVGELDRDGQLFQRLYCFGFGERRLTSYSFCTLAVDGCILPG